MKATGDQATARSEYYTSLLLIKVKGKRARRAVTGKRNRKRSPQVQFNWDVNKQSNSKLLTKRQQDGKIGYGCFPTGLRAIHSRCGFRRAPNLIVTPGSRHPNVVLVHLPISVHQGLPISSLPKVTRTLPRKVQQDPYHPDEANLYFELCSEE